MNANYLSKRLATVASYVPKGSRLLDVGSDHAYLPVYLARQKVVDFGVASEVALGPYRNMIHEINLAGVSNVIHPRLADGLAALTKQDHVNVITITGMGGKLITEILERGRYWLKTGPRLVLQPNVGADHLRKWLMLHFYQIVHEQVVADRRHIYDIDVAEPCRMKVRYSPRQLFFGPLLLKKKSLVFIKKWRGEVDHLIKVVNSMKKSKRHKPFQRMERLNHRIKVIKQVINK